MEPNQNQSSERDWTIQEREEFFTSQDAITLNFNDIPKQPSIEWTTGAWNGPIQPLSSDDPFGDLERLFPGSVAHNVPMSSNQETITLDGLKEMATQMEDKFSRLPPYYRVHSETFEYMKNKFKAVPADKLVTPFSGVELRVDNRVPVGEVWEPEA